MAAYKVLFEALYTILILLTMVLFCAGVPGLGGPERSLLPKICLHIPQR